MHHQVHRNFNLPNSFINLRYHCYLYIHYHYYLNSNYYKLYYDIHCFNHINFKQGNQLHSNSYCCSFILIITTMIKFTLREQVITFAFKHLNFIKEPMDFFTYPLFKVDQAKRLKEYVHLNPI